MKTIQERHEIAEKLRSLPSFEGLVIDTDVAKVLGLKRDFPESYNFTKESVESLAKAIEPYGYYADMSYFLLPHPKEPLIEVCETEPSPGRLAIKVNPIEDAINRWCETLEDEVCQMLFETFCRETCRWELVNRGAIYDIYGCSRCGYEHVENKCDAGATELDPVFCPSCGAKVVDDD